MIPISSTSEDTWLQVKDILLDCSLSSPETRRIICIDECQVLNILKQSESECETPWVSSPATWRKLTRSWTRTMGGAGSGRPTTARPGDGWRPPLTQGFWWEMRHFPTVKAQCNSSNPITQTSQLSLQVLIVQCINERRIFGKSMRWGISFQEFI